MRVEAPSIATAVSKEPTVWLSGELTTFLNKLVFPVIWVAVILGTLAAVLVKTGHISVANDFRFIVLAFLVGTGFMLWFGLRVQRVGYAGRELVISNYWREARIPFDEVGAVEPVWWYRGRLVRIELRLEGPFGQVVYYLPKWGFVRCFWSSPEKELRELIFHSFPD
jgi:hypothetical protein